MVELPKFPKRPKLDKNPIKTAGTVLKEVLTGIQEAAQEIDSAVKQIDLEVSSPIEEPKNPIEVIASATVCLQCCRDHWSTISGALSEAVRFARSDGIESKDAQGRLGVALDEMNIMERIDLAPQALVELKGKERELAEWSLKNSRQFRHLVGELKSIESLEQAAAQASTLREEFMTKYSEVKRTYAEECKECESLQDLRNYLKQRKNK